MRRPSPAAGLQFERRRLDSLLQAWASAGLSAPLLLLPVASDLLLPRYHPSCDLSIKY